MWNFQQNLQSKQAAECSWHNWDKSQLKWLPLKTTTNHAGFLTTTKNQKGDQFISPFTPFTFQPDLNAACRCLQFVPAPSDLRGEPLESTAFLQHSFSRLTKHLVAGRGGWSGVRCEVRVGAGLWGTCPGASPAALSVAGSAQAELPHCPEVTCLKWGRETKMCRTPQENVGFFSAIPPREKSPFFSPSF